jgi:hypothetical protein
MIKLTKSATLLESIKFSIALSMGTVSASSLSMNPPAGDTLHIDYMQFLQYSSMKCRQGRRREQFTSKVFANGY